MYCRNFIFYYKWSYSMYSLLCCCMSCWNLSNKLYYNIRQSVHTLHSRLKLFFIKWGFTVFALL